MTKSLSSTPSDKSRASARAARQRSPTSCAASEIDFLCVVDNSQPGILENAQHTSDNSQPGILENAQHTSASSSFVSDLVQCSELHNSQWGVVDHAQRSGEEEEVEVVAFHDAKQDETLNAHHAVEEEEALNTVLNARHGAEEEDACSDEEAEALNTLLNTVAEGADAAHGSPTTEGGAAGDGAGDVVASVVMGLEEEAELLLVTCERLHQEVSVLRAEQMVLVEDHRERTATLEAEIASLRALLGGGGGEGGGEGDADLREQIRVLRASKEELDDEVVYLKQSFNEVMAVLNKVQEVPTEKFVQDGVFSADGYSDAVPQAPHPSSSMDTSVSPPAPPTHSLLSTRNPKPQRWLYSDVEYSGLGH
jgi:hypothetical protein